MVTLLSFSVVMRSIRHLRSYAANLFFTPPLNANGDGRSDTKGRGNEDVPITMVTKPKMNRVIWCYMVDDLFVIHRLVSLCRRKSGMALPGVQ